MKNISTILSICAIAICLMASNTYAYNDRVSIDSIDAVYVQSARYQKISERSFLNERSYLDGYDTTDITVTIDKSSGTTKLLVINNTPRIFKEININIDGNPIHIPHKLNDFTEVSFTVSSANLNSAIETSFIDPMPAFISNVSEFSEATTSSAILTETDQESYRLMQAALREFYTKIETRNKFYNYFINDREEDDVNASLMKWFTTTTYEPSKQYRVGQGDSAGLASGSWLAVNWPMSSFSADRTYTGTYSFYSHEFAHTMGFGHSSGLAYGWDDFVTAGIRGLLSSGELVAGEIPTEDGEVFWIYDRAEQLLTPYTTKTNGHSVSNIHLVYDNNDFITKVEKQGQGLKLNFSEYYTSGARIFLNADVDNTDNLSALIFQTESNLESETNLGTVSSDFKEVYINDPSTTGSSTPVFFVPTYNNDNVIATDAKRDRSQAFWGAGQQSNFITVLVTNLDDNMTYEANFTVNKGNGYDLVDGLGGNDFIVTWDEEANSDLPKGRYVGDFTMGVAMWGDAAYRNSSLVRIYHEQNLGDNAVVIAGSSSTSVSSDAGVSYSIPGQFGLTTTESFDETHVQLQIKNATQTQEYYVDLTCQNSLGEAIDTVVVATSVNMSCSVNKYSESYAVLPYGEYSATFLVNQHGAELSIIEMNVVINRAENENIEPPLDGDYDGDGILNGYEESNGLDWRDPTDAWEDLDNDGIPNIIESKLNTDASVADSNKDVDGDGFTTLEEYQNGTDPFDRLNLQKSVDSIATTDDYAARLNAIDLNPYTHEFEFGFDIKWAENPAFPGVHMLASKGNSRDSDQTGWSTFIENNTLYFRIKTTGGKRSAVFVNNIDDYLSKNITYKFIFKINRINEMLEIYLDDTMLSTQSQYSAFSSTDNIESNEGITIDGVLIN